MFIRRACLLLVVALTASCGAPAETTKSGEARSAPTKDAKVGKHVPLRLWPEAKSVRLFVEDIPHNTPGAPEHLMSNPEGILLTKAQRAIVEGATVRYKMTSQEAADNAMDACFIPHHFFRFYNAANTQIGELAVCYCCMDFNLIPMPAVPDQEKIAFDFQGIEKMMADMGVKSDVQCTP